MTKVVSTIASMPGGDNKKDRYPSRNRPVFVFTKMRSHSMLMWRSGSFKGLAPLYSGQAALRRPPTPPEGAHAHGRE